MATAAPRIAKAGAHLVAVWRLAFAIFALLAALMLGVLWDTERRKASPPPVEVPVTPEHPRLP